jgi:hypothetical protein
MKLKHGIFWCVLVLLASSAPETAWRLAGAAFGAPPGGVIAALGTESGPARAKFYPVPVANAAPSSPPKYRAPHPGEYVAFSLKVAEARLRGHSADDRAIDPEVYHLGGITQIHGLVYDKGGRDVIIVGRYAPDRAVLTSDDLVVALRARLIHGAWPLVSIDPTAETPTTQMQKVRFAGGIEDTPFGADLFDADYRLKRLAMGLLEAGAPGFRTYWELGKEREFRRSLNISSRFWFYPVLPSVTVREDVVAIKGLTVGVFTEVLAAEIDGKKVEDPASFQDVVGDTFAKEVSGRFDELARVHPSFARLQGLDELVALTRAIEEMEEKPDLSYWLKTYRVRPVQTERAVQLLRRSGEFERPGRGRSSCELLGGVQLMAIALRL